MNQKKKSSDKSTGKFLSLILRHEPGVIGIELDENGWVDIDGLLSALARHGRPLSRSRLNDLVENNDKKRYAVSDDGKRIRANQGHSVEVDLAYEPAEPPEFLYHGTPDRFVLSIKETGLQKRSRHHVHLSERLETARAVGQRRGRAVILVVAAQRMRNEGFDFFVTPNGVWLTDNVPVEYLDFPM